VAAASSLTDALSAVAADWKARGGSIEVTFDASSRLASQIAAGTPVDLFLSADVEWMDFLATKELVDRASRIDLLSNELVLVVPTVSRLEIRSPSDLTKPLIRKVALAAENVPAGRYARQALSKLGLWDAVQGRVVNGANVRQALRLAAEGEVDAAIVYKTDALSEKRVRTAFAFPPDSHSPIIYPAAIVRGSPNQSEAQRFLQFCRSDAAQKIFKSAGFAIVKVN
jgi:molybdate transport system substrate-binding protein